MYHTRASWKHLFKGSGRNVEYTTISSDRMTQSYEKVDNGDGLYGDVSMTPLYEPYKGVMETSL